MNSKMYLLFLLMLISCNTRNHSIEQKNTTLDNQKVFLYGKDVKSIYKVLNDSLEIRGHFLFLYNGFDCEACIKNGYKLAKTIGSLTNKHMVHIISTSANIGRDQLVNNYMRYIHNDENDLIRKELKYIYTPAFLYIDSMKRIGNVYYPNNERKIRDENLFINNCLN